MQPTIPSHTHTAALLVQFFLHVDEDRLAFMIHQTACRWLGFAHGAVTWIVTTDVSGRNLEHSFGIKNSLNVLYKAKSKSIHSRLEKRSKQAKTFLGLDKWSTVPRDAVEVALRYSSATLRSTTSTCEHYSNVYL